MIDRAHGDRIFRCGYALCALVCLVACDGEASMDAPEDERAARPELDPPPARLRDASGAVRVGATVSRRGQAIDAEQVIDVPENGRAVISLRDGGRVVLEGGTRAQVVEQGAAQVLLVRGGAHVMQPPSGSSPRPPLRIVTPAAIVEIGASGEAYVAHSAAGASWVGVLRGTASVANGEAVRRRLRSVDLGAGQSVAVTNRISEPVGFVRRLSDARRAARATVVEPTEPEAERLAREMTSEARRLDEALHWLETETRRGRELTNQHGAAVREGRAEEATDLQSELAEHGQALYRLRQLATARWERLRAQWLRLSEIAPSRSGDPVRERRERVVGLLGL